MHVWEDSSGSLPSKSTECSGAPAPTQAIFCAWLNCKSTNVNHDSRERSLCHKKKQTPIVFAAVLAVGGSDVLTNYFSETIDLFILMSTSSILELQREINCAFWLVLKVTSHFFGPQSTHKECS